MKILLSAYACDPLQQSESAVGWHWARILAAAGHEVWIITRSPRENIESYLKANPVPNLHFAYHQVNWLPHFIGRTHAGYYFQYVAWQWEAYRLAKRLHQQVSFSCVQHVTFVTIRFPSFMGLLGIPFIFGPVAGGERPTWELAMGFPPKRWPREFLRLFSNAWVRFDPILRWFTLGKATRIVCTSPETACLLAKKFRAKVRVHLGIGLNNGPAIARPRPAHSGAPMRIAYIGRLLYLKGVHLALRAFAQCRQGLAARLTIIGDGPDAAWLHRLADSLGLRDCVDWRPWMHRSELLASYSHFDLLLFPSTRDSGGFVVLEALSRGVPVICLDRGGPGVIVNQSCGRRIPTAGRKEAEIVEAVAAALRELSDRKAIEAMRPAAERRAREFTWEALVRQVYGDIWPDENFDSKPARAAYSA